MKRFALALLLAAAGLPAAAQTAEWTDIERFETASSLGLVLASEEFCNLSFNQTAVESYIDQNVPADDMAFTSDLRAGITMGEYQIESMKGADAVAHCRQIARVAKSFGFIE